MVDINDEGVVVNTDGVEDDKDVEHFDCGRDDDDENVDLVASRPSGGEVRVFTQPSFVVVIFKQFFLSFSLSLFWNFVIFTLSFFVISKFNSGGAGSARLKQW